MAWKLYKRRLEVQKIWLKGAIQRPFLKRRHGGEHVDQRSSLTSNEGHESRKKKNVSGV